MKFAAIGDNCIDVYQNLGKGYPGGGPVNFAVRAARLGVSTAYIGLIGEDANGALLRYALLAEGVDISHLQSMPGATAVAYVRLEGTERVFVGKDRGVREKLVVNAQTDEFLRGFQLVHTTLDGCVDAHIPRWKAMGLAVSYDFSHRATPDQIKLLPYIDYAFFSGQKHTWDEGPDLLRHYHSQGGRLVVMTFGQRGSLAFDGKNMVQQLAQPVEVVDTMGAGDAFQAGFVTTSMSGGALEQALLMGTISGAHACTESGGFGHGIDL
jgi:fructoselysine 6-kinase